MASSFERDIKIIFSFVKDQSKYDIPKITKELNELQNKLEDFGKFISSQFSLKISGIKDITELKNALISLNRTIVPVTDKFGNFANVIKNGLEGLNVLQIAQIESTLKELAAALSGISVAALNKQLNELAKVSKDVADKVVLTIKPLNDFENAIGKLDIKIQSSIANLLQYGQILEFISKSATSFAGLQGVKVPKIDVKSQENDVNKLLAEYTKLSGIIDRAGESVNKFNIANSRKLDEGSKKELISDIKRIKDSYDQLQAVIYQLNLRYQQLSSTENADAVVLDKLSQEISEANALQNQRLQILNKSKQAEIELTNIEAKRKEVYNDQFNALGGVIKRQIQFITSAGILAGSVNFVRKGFKDTLDTLSEVQRVLTVSRSNFLSTADTIGLLRNTISDFSIKTGQSVRDVATVLKELGSAGLTTEQSIAALGPTLNNIIATDSNVVETTRLVASTYNILGDAVTGTSDQLSNFSRINDILARASLESSLELDQLVQALKFSLPAAKDAGLQLEDLVGILAQLADQGIKGGNAGRALRAALQQISKDAPRFAQTFNIPIDLNKPLQFLDIVRKFGDNIKGQEISAEELGDVFTRLGLRGADVFLLLGQSIDKVDNKIKDLRENSKGISEITADIRLESPERQIAILSENLSKLSGKIFEPIILGINLLIKKFNELATTVSLVGNNAFIKYSGYILGAVAVTKIFIELIGFVGGGLIKLSTAITTVQAASGAFAAIMAVIGGSLNVILIVVGLLAVAVAGLAYLWTTKLAPSSAIVVKSLEDQNKALSKQILENNKLINSYDGISKQLLKNKKDLDEGLITIDEYRNGLNELSNSNEEINNILVQFGLDAEGASRAIKELSSAKLELNKILKDEKQALAEINYEENKKQIQELLPELFDAQIYLRNLRNEASSISSVLDKTDFGKRLKENIKKTSDEVTRLQKLIKEIEVKNLNLAAESFKKDFADKIRLETKGIRVGMGDLVTGLDNELSRLISISEIFNASFKDFDISNLVLQIKELSGATDLLKGGESLRAKILFDFDVDISEKSVKEINDKFAEINLQTASNAVGQSFVNNLNFSGLAQLFTEQFQKAGFRSLKVEDLIGGLKDISSAFPDITDASEKTANQFILINSLFSQILQKQIDFIINQKNIAKSSGDTSAVERLNSEIQKLEKQRLDILSEINVLAKNESLAKQKQTEATKLQQAQENLRKFELNSINKILRESSIIRRSQIDQAKNDLFISESKLQVLRKNLNLEKQVEKTTGVQNTEKILEATKKVADATKQAVQNREKLFQLELKISQQNELSELALRKISQTGTNIIDQSRIDLQINNKKLLFKLKELEGDKKKGILAKQYKEIESEVNVIIGERIQLQQKIREEQLVQQRTAEELQNRINELVFARTGQELTLFELANKESELKNKILDIDKQIKETIDKEGFTSGTVNSLILKQKGLVIDILKNKKEQILASRKTYDNELKIFDLQGDLLSRSSKLTQDAISRVEDPLRKLIGLRIEAKPFDEIFKISRALNLSLTETNAIFGNTELATDLLFKGIKEGTVDFNRLDESIRKPALALREFNLQLQEQRRIQNEINKQKIEIFEKLLDQAIKFKDFKGATEALQNLANASEVVDIKTGNIDLSKTQKNLSDLQQQLEKIKKEDFEVNILSQLPDAIRESTKALKELSAVLDRTKIDFTSDIINASGTDKKTGSSFIDKIEITNNSLGNIDKSTSEFNTKFDKFISQMETIVAVLIKDKKGFSFGGLVPGSGSGDIVPAMLEPGEFVIPKKIVEQKGVGFFENLIGGKPIEGFALGGLVRGYKNGGIVSKQDVAQFELQNIIESIFNNVEDSKNILNRIYGNDISYYPSFIQNQQNINQILLTISDNISNISENSKLSYNQLVDIFNKIPDDLSRSKFATGGLVPGSGSGDIVPAMLEPGEFVIPKNIVEQKGVSYFENLIGGKPVEGFALGGLVRAYRNGGVVSKQDIVQFELQNIVESIFNNVEDSKNTLNRIYGNDISYYPSFINGINNNNMFLEKIAESNNIIKDYSKLSYSQLVDIFNKIPDNLSKIFDKPVNNKLDTTKFATGGLVPGSGSGDIVPAMLEPGEFVIPKKIVEQKGVGFFENLIGKNSEGFKYGGLVGNYKDGGSVENIDRILNVFFNKLNKGFEKFFNNFDKKLVETNNNIQIKKEIEDIFLNIEIPTLGKLSEFKNLGIGLGGLKELNKLGELKDLFGNINENSDGLKPIIDNFKNVNSIIDNINKEIIELQSSILNPFKSLEDQLQRIASTSANVFDRISAKALLKLIPTIDKIEDKFRELFTQDLPSFIGFFLDKVVLSNIKILSQYEKQRKKLQENYKNQKADLIEALKRNEISYFDFFDKLEDLQDNRKKEEEDNRKEELDALTDSIRDAFGEIANKLKDIVKDMSETFSNFVLGIPAGLDLIAGNFGTLFSGINKAFVNLFSNFGIEVKGFAGGIGVAIGGAIGGISSLLGGPGGLLAGVGIGGAIGDTVGGVVESIFSVISGPLKIFGQALLTSVTGFFNFALQGFSELLPLVIQLGLMTNDEFEAFVNSVSTLPDKIKEVTTGLADRIPKIVDILTSVDNANAEPLLVTIAKSFADGMEKVFQQIIPAFGKIVGVAVVAVQPILVKFLKLIPEFISQLGPLVLELIPAFITLVAQIVTAFVQSIRNDLPRIAANILSTINTILDTFISQLLSPRFIGPITNAIAGAATEAAPVIANTLGRSGEIIVNSVSQAAPGIVTAFENQFPKIGDKLLQSISTNINSGALDVGPKITTVLSDGISKFIKEFLASIPKIVTFLGSLLLSTIKNVLNEISNIRNVFSNIGNVIKEEFTKNIKDELAKLPENITEAFKAIKQTIQDILNDPTIVLTITLGIAGAFISAMGLASEKGIENFIDTFIAKIPEVITAFFDIFSPDNISKISISIIDGIDKALQSGLGNLDIEGRGFSGVLGNLVEIGKQFSKFILLLGSMNIFMTFLFSIIQEITAFAPPLGILVGFFLTITGIITELNLTFKIWQIILLEVLKVLFQFGKFLSQEFISALISIQDQFDDLLQATNEVIIQFSILTSDIFAGVSVAILSITNVFKKLTEDSIFTTKSIDAARKAASTFGDILKNVLGKTIDSLIRSSNKVSDLLIKLQNSILGTGVVVDSTTKIFDEISSIIDETNKVLEPLVDFLMPGLEVLLTALALILVGPLLIGLTAIIIELELMIIVIDLLNSSFETLAPIIEELSPIFEQLSPVFEKIFIAIKPFIAVLLALTIIFILLTSPIGPLIAVLVILSVTVIAISKSIELFNKVSSDLIPIINDLIKYFNEVILPIVLVIGKIIILASVIGLLLSPIGPLIIGIGLLVGAFIIFLKILPSIIKLLNSIISPIVRIFKSLIRIVGLLLSLFVRKISDVFKDIVNRINVFLDPIINTIIEGFIFIRDSINIIVNEITQFIINGFISIRDLINEILNPIVNFVTENFNIIRNIIFEVITNIRDFIILEFTNIYNQIVIALTPLITAVDIFITPIIDGIIEFMNNIYNIIITGLNDIMIGIIEFSQPFIDVVIGLFNTLMTAISFAIRLAIDLINNEILIPLQTRVNEIVTSISQTIDELFESNPELQEIKEEFIKIKESLSEIVDSFINFREDIKTEFNGLINDLIKIVQNANPTNVVNSSSGGSSSGGGFSPPGIPGLALGGLIKGMKGKDKIPAMVSDGEFIIKKDIVDKYGSKFFDIINKGGKVQQALKNYGDTSTNANTREYYLSNFFADDAGSGRGSSVTANQVDGPDSGTTISRSNSVAFRGDTVAGTAAPQTVETNNTEKKIDINFNIDFKGANFTSEDAADNVKNSIVEELDNNQGELARKIREMLKG